jgi:hypothetical protein
MAYCVNTGDLLTTACKKTACLHYCADAKTNCLQHLYDRPLTLLDVAHLEGRNFPEARRIQRLAENKIVAWSKVLEGVDRLRPIAFTRMLEAIHSKEESLADEIAANIYTLIAPPMSYLKSELWFPVLRNFRSLLVDSNIATAKNKAVWHTLTVHEVF